jgi:hypothetical protein
MLRKTHIAHALPKELDHVVGVVRYMREIHENDVRELAQAQHDEIQQMKRDYAYGTHQLKTQNAKELKAATDVLIVSNLSCP